MGDAGSERELLERVNDLAVIRAARVHADREAVLATAKLLVGRRRVSTLARTLRQEMRGRRASGIPIPLAALPRASESGTVAVEPSRPVGGVWRSCLRLDPPSQVSWQLDLECPAVVHGWLAVLPEVWETRYEPVRLDVNLRTPAGGLLATTSLTLHPRVQLEHRRWVPWRLALPAAGASTLELTSVAPLGGLDRAWLAVGDAALVIRPRTRAARRTASPLAAAAALRPKQPPVVSFLMPVHDPELDLLVAAVESVRAQGSTGWELCIVDDGSQRDDVRAWLDDVAAADHRIRFARHVVAQGISAATNAALALARGEFVATLDHDDLLHPQALEYVGSALATSPEVDMLYTDNDIVVGDRRFSAALKPDWSPDALRACMYTLHLGVYRRSLVVDLGGWRSAFDGAQDHDLVLRISERTNRIEHLPAVLAHWRAHAGSAAMGELAKPYAYERGRAAVEEHVRRLGSEDAEVERLPTAGMYRVRYVRSAPVVVLVPSALGPDGQAAWRGVLRPSDVLRVFDEAAPRLQAWQSAAADLPGDALVVVVEDACAPPESVDELVGYVEAGAAAAGGVVVDEHERLMAGPVAFVRGVPVGLHHGADLAEPMRHPSLCMATNRAALRGVVALTADALRRTPVDSPQGAGAMIAVTASLGVRGGRVVFVPHVSCVATQDAARRWGTTVPKELIQLIDVVPADRFWNPQRSPWQSDEGYDEQDLIPEFPIVD